MIRISPEGVLRQGSIDVGSQILKVTFACFELSNKIVVNEAGLTSSPDRCPVFIILVRVVWENKFLHKLTKLNPRAGIVVVLAVNVFEQWIPVPGVEVGLLVWAPFRFVLESRH